jgi:hypothetical protein
MDVAHWAIGTLAPHLRQVTIAHLFRVRLPKIITTIDKKTAAMNMRAAMVIASIPKSYNSKISITKAYRWPDA